MSFLLNVCMIKFRQISLHFYIFQSTTYIYITFTTIFNRPILNRTCSIHHYIYLFRISYQFSHMQSRKNFNMLVNGYSIKIEISNQQPSHVQLLITDCENNRVYQLKINNQELQQKFRDNILIKKLEDLYSFFEKNHHEKDKITVGKQGKIILTTNTEKSDEKNQNTFVLQPIQITTNHGQKFNHQQKDTKDLIQPIVTSFKENGNSIIAIQNQKSRQQIICEKAADLLRIGVNVNTLAKHLKISEQTCHKMNEQFKKFGKIIPPKRSNHSKRQQQQNDHLNRDPKDLQQQAITLSPVTPNMKIQGPIVQKIRHILYQLVQQGKMTTLEEMQQYLIRFNVQRSLSSIYRYVANIKAEHKQFQSRCYAMHRKHNNNNIVTSTTIRRY